MAHPNVLVLINEISREFPTFRIRRKADSMLMRWIGLFLFLASLGKNRAFMTDFVTTLGTTVYVPVGWEDYMPTSQCITLRHERVHMRQARKHGMLVFAFLYLFWPVPFFRAAGRRKFEQEAYEESIRALYEYGEDPTNLGYRIRMIGHFTSSEYLYMWTNRADIEKWLETTTSRIIGEKKN